jgi:hypothetical protein
MTRRTSRTKRKPTNTNGKDASPRGGMKTKQTKVADGAGTGSPGPQQTKLSFAPTATTDKASIPTRQPNSAIASTPTVKAYAKTTIAITPEPGRLLTESPREPTDPITQENTSKKTKTKKQTFEYRRSHRKALSIKTSDTAALSMSHPAINPFKNLSPFLRLTSQRSKQC